MLYFLVDGKWIVFSVEYDGNIDVYVIFFIGGEVCWLIWYFGRDFV